MGEPGARPRPRLERLLVAWPWRSGTGRPGHRRLAGQPFPGGLPCPGRGRAGRGRDGLSAGGVTPSADATLSEDGVARVGAAASFDWLLDPWGGQAARLRAARARALAAGAEARAAELLTLLSLGTAYVDLRHAEALRGLRLAEQGRRREALNLYRSLEQAGEATRLDIVRNRARIAEIDVALPGLASDIAAARAQIALLLGRSASEPLSLADRPQPLPRLAPDVGVPTDLLRNRPDIHAAELAYAAAVADIDTARAALYPSLSLSGVIGYDVTDGRGAGRAVFGPSLRFPALPASGARAEVRRRHALATEAHALWQQTVLEAVAEVETALAAYRAAHAARGAAERAVALNREARTLTLDLVREGARTLTDLIEVETSLAAAERQLVAARRDAGRSFVALNVRLGVGRGADASGQTAEARPVR